MITNFSEEAKNVLQHAKKNSICMLKPVVKEELVFYALVDMQHPLWLILKDKFCMNDDMVKNNISAELVRNHPDDPENPENIKRQKKYIETAAKEAHKKKASHIEPVHLLRAIFSSKDNFVAKFMEKKGTKPEVILEAIGNISYVDLTEAIHKADRHSSYAPSTRMVRATEDYSTGLSLTKFGRNLNNLAKEGKIDPVYFRDEEIQTVIEILCRRQQNNPLLVGDAGVGKTAIAEGIAQLIVQGKIPDIMKDKEIIEISIT